MQSVSLFSEKDPELEARVYRYVKSFRIQIHDDIPGKPEDLTAYLHYEEVSYEASSTPKLVATSIDLYGSYDGPFYSSTGLDKLVLALIRSWAVRNNIFVPHDIEVI